MAAGQIAPTPSPWAAAFQEERVSTEVILLIIGFILALPGGLFVAFLSSMARAKWAALLGGIIGGAVVGLAILFYVNTANVGIDGLSYFYGVFFACSVGVALGALIVNFLVGLASRNSNEALPER
jgi:hypothetical protein